jgi:broad specificity phosphatase PhoE
VLARELAGQGFDAVYSSPLKRAAETARIVASRLGLDLQLSAGLMEVDVGSWSGLTRDEVAIRFPEGYRRWLEYGHGWDDGESYDELGRRVVSDLLRIADQHADEVVLAVTHGGPIRSALAASAGISYGKARRSIAVLENCATVRIVVRDGNLFATDGVSSA